MFEGGARHDVDVDTEQLGQFSGQPSQRHNADADVKVYEQIDVTGIGVVTSGDTAEDTHVARPAPGGDVDQGTTVPTETPAKSRVGQPESIAWCGSQLKDEMMAGSFDQLDEGTKAWFTPVGLIRADHRLGDTGASRKIGLRQSSS